MCNSTTFALRHTQISLSGIWRHFWPPSRHLLLNTHDTNMEFLQLNGPLLDIFLFFSKTKIFHSHPWAWQGRGARGLSFLSMDRPEHHSIDDLKERGMEKGSSNIPPSEEGNDLCSTRQTLALFWGQPWGDCWETGWSTFGPFWAL